MDEKLRQTGQVTEKEDGDALALSDALIQKIRAGEADVQLATTLSGYTETIRDKALQLVGLDEGRQDVLKAMVMLEAQLDQALESAIQPREGDAPLPSLEAILTSIQRTLTPEQARVFLDKKEVHEPTLLLVPVTSVDRYQEVLREASRIMEGSQEPYLSEFVLDQLNALATQAEVEGSKIKKWRFAITEGAQTFDIPEWDNGQEGLHQRIRARFNPRFAKNGISRIDYQSYIALMNKGLRQGKPIDCKYENDSRKRNAKFTWQHTLTNETNPRQHSIGGGEWNPHSQNVALYGHSLVSSEEVHARFRLAVMGDIV